MPNPSTEATPGSTTEPLRLIPESWVLITWLAYALLLMMLSVTAFMCFLMAVLA